MPSSAHTSTRLLRATALVVSLAASVAARAGSVDVERLAKGEPARDPAFSQVTPLPQIWRVELGDATLKGVFQHWSDAAGWQLVWELPVDFPVQTRAQFTGSYEEAVSAVALSLEHADTPIKVIFYRGNKVLRVLSKGAQ
jgi:hypothetical protein